MGLAVGGEPGHVGDLPDRGATVRRVDTDERDEHGDLGRGEAEDGCFVIGDALGHQPTSSIETTGVVRRDIGLPLRSRVPAYTNG